MHVRPSQQSAAPPLSHASPSPTHGMHVPSIWPVCWHENPSQHGELTLQPSSSTPHDAPVVAPAPSLLPSVSSPSFAVPMLVPASSSVAALVPWSSALSSFAVALSSALSSLPSSV